MTTMTLQSFHEGGMHTTPKRAAVILGCYEDDFPDDTWMTVIYDNNWYVARGKDRVWRVLEHEFATEREAATYLWENAASYFYTGE